MVNEKNDASRPLSGSLPRPASSPNLTHSKSHPKVRENDFPFAGRIGGNQEFTIDRSDPNRARILKEIPDAAPFSTWKASFDLNQFRQVNLWKAALIEGWGTLMITYLTVMIAVGLAPIIKYSSLPYQGILLNFYSELSTGPLVPAIIGGITNAILLALFIFSSGPVSGGHLNPTITIATFFARLSTFPRAILYVGFQMAGASLGGLLVRASLGNRTWNLGLGGCYLNTRLVSSSEALAIEFTSDMALIFLSFGVGLDPRQRAVFGPALAPIFVGLILGVISGGTGFVKPGYAGVSANPARCFGAMVGSHFSAYHWVHWVGPILAGLVNGVLYHIVPPYFHLKPLDN